MPESFRENIFRIIVIMSCFSIATWVAKTGAEEGRWGFMLLAFPIAIGGLLINWRFIYGLIAGPMHHLIDSIIFPGGKLDKPTLNLKLPAHYLSQGRYSDALDEYEQIIKYFPDEVIAYEKAIWLYCEIFDEQRAAQRLASRAKRRHLVLDDHIIALTQRKQDLSEETFDAS